MARMTDHYDLDRANALLPDLGEKLRRLRLLRREVVALRDGIVALRPEPVTGGAAGGGSTAPGGLTPEVEAEARTLHLRLQGVVDQMQAAVLEISDLGLELRDIESGLVDFPALVAGRPVWLCWRLGEDSIGWWHDFDKGFDARRRIEDLA
jgi:hypothetical protein